MKRFDRISAGVELICKLVDLTFRIAEDKGARNISRINQTRKDFDFVRFSDLNVVLFDKRYGQFLGSDFDMNRLVQILIRQFDNCSGHGCRKEYLLDFFRGGFENRVDVFDETHVEHFIRFVENDLLKMIELKGLPAHVIHHTSRCSDDDLRLALQRENLTIDRLAAVDRNDADAFFVFCDVVKFFRCLNRKLSCRRENQRRYEIGCVVNRIDDRNAKRTGLSRAGLRLSEKVFTFKNIRNCLRLNRRSFLKSHISERL